MTQSHDPDRQPDDSEDRRGRRFDAEAHTRQEDGLPPKSNSSEPRREDKSGAED